jgi:hypothetical protein
MEPRMNTGRMAASQPRLRATQTCFRWNLWSDLGSFQALPKMAISAMQTPQMSRPGRMPAANMPAIETPMIEP